MTKKRIFKESELVFAENPKVWNFKDLCGEKFGKLAIIGFAGIQKNHTYWYCKCECKNIVKVRAEHLKSGAIVSCGCFRLERVKESCTTHGQAKKGHVSLTYKIWQNMLMRCYNSKNLSFHRYGGRGIFVCERWQKFENFLSDMGEKPKDLTLDRKDNNGNYEPSNCRWATRKEQANNTRRNRVITHNGKTQNVTQWESELGMNRGTLSARINKSGWSIEQALTKSIRVRK